MTPASMPGTSFPAGRPPTRTLARGGAARSRRTPGRHTGDLYQAKALFAERSAYETAKTANHSSAVSIPE
jgi:hypothetical protein